MIGLVMREKSGRHGARLGRAPAILWLCVLTNGPARAELPQGYEIVTVAAFPDQDHSPAINNCGEIAWTRDIDDAQHHIYYYENGKTTRLSFDNRENAFPDINDSGDIVWMAWTTPSTFDVMMMTEGEIEFVDNGRSPSINNLGHVSWEYDNGQECFGKDIYFYDGQSAQIVSPDGFSHVSSNLNDLDQIVWTQRSMCENPIQGEIPLYDVPKGTLTLLTTDQFQAQQADINNAGQVAFTYRYDCSPDCSEAIAIWEDGVATQLTDWGINPQMNDCGEIYFLRWHDENSTWQGWWYDGSGTFYQITDDPFWNTDGDINNYGEAVWEHGSFPVKDIQYMRRIRNGEFDFDGTVDPADHATFVDCLTAPGEFDGLCHCRFGDIQHDRDVDLADWAVLQNNFTTSGGPGGGGG